MANSKKTKDETQDTLMITQSGLERLEQELEERTAQRLVIAEEIDEARQLGDLRENEPYHNAMQKKEINDARIEELEYMIANAQVVEAGDDGKIGIGSNVVVLNVKRKKEKEITLVGKQAAQEANPREGKISIDSPLGSALMGQKKGDEIDVELPVGKTTYEIKKVS